MKITYRSLHKVDHITNQILEKQSEDIPLDYLRDIITKVEEKKGVRRHKFVSKTVEAKTLINYYFNGEFEDYKERFPIKLRDIEKEKHAQVIKLGQGGIRAGVLFQVVYEHQKMSKIIIVKSDNIGFFDDENFSLRTGLPKDKKVFKAVLIERLKDNDEMVYIYTEQDAVYWWKDFLDLEELQTDEVNTEQAFKAIERRISPLKKEYKAEHRILKNILISHFRSKDDFDIVEVAGLIGDYKLQNPTLEDKLRKKLKEMEKQILEFPKTKHFDSKFKIISKAIPLRKIREEIKLRPNLTLNIKGDIQALESVVTPKIINGIKTIVIHTDDGYREFGGTGQN